MDLLPQMLVGIRREARSTVYRTALQRQMIGCYGYLLGNQEEFVRPVIELALVAEAIATPDGFWGLGNILQKWTNQAHETARTAETKVIGVFAAWEDAFDPHRHRRMGLLIDTAQLLRVPLAVVFPTDGGESLWGVNLFFANRFPHDPLSYLMLPRRSHLPQHNPRRIRRCWVERIHG